MAGLRSAIAVVTLACLVALVAAAGEPVRVE